MQSTFHGDDGGAVFYMNYKYNPPRFSQKESDLFDYRVADSGGISRYLASTKNGLYVKRREREGKKNPQITGTMCSMGFQTYTHPDGLIDEPNESPKKSKGGNKGRHKGLKVELCGGGGGGRTI